MSGAPQGGNIWKNIIIGVLTTVVAYLIVHFIFDKKDAKKEARKKREKIETTWNAVNEYINRSKEKFTTIGCFSCDAVEMKNELLRELDQMNKSLQNIKEEEGVDEKMKTIIDRTIRMFEDEKPVLSAFYDTLSLYKDLKGEAVLPINRRAQQTMLNKMSHIQSRDTADFTRYLDDLNKKYKTKLVLKEFKPEINTDELTGRWEVDCSYTMNIRSNHKATIESSGEKYTGEWSVDDNVFRIGFDDGSVLTHRLIQLDHSFMLFFIVENDVFSGACRK
ncbi:MAG: DUF4205 domain-containing protein [Chitinophagaceae bacterium]|nr:DUF4205 domain-containing protein [Chitinophagaceae bacterium]